MWGPLISNIQVMKQEVSEGGGIDFYLQFIFCYKATTRIQPANAEHLLLAGWERDPCSRFAVLGDHPKVIPEHQLLGVEVCANGDPSEPRFLRCHL